LWLAKRHTGPGGGADETITYQYNANDELISQTSSLSAGGWHRTAWVPRFYICL
jgi:hypothetical protein